MNSRNSSKPPSSDGMMKPKMIPGSQRESSGKKPGGQRGHPGKTLEWKKKPDHVIVHALRACTCCGKNLEKIKPCATETRQSFDLPPIQIQVTEHRSEIKNCPSCHMKTRAPFPAGIDSKIGYGPNLKGLSTYLVHRQLIPPRRVREIIQEILGHRISTGSIMLWSESAHHELGAFEKSLI